MERNAAEQDLIGLLQRALKSVPFLRLDKSDEVLEKFRSACALLEDNLVEDYSLSDLDNAENGEDDTAFGRVVRRSPTNAPRHAHDSGDEEEKERDRGVSMSKRMDIPVLDRKVTTDYSSPSLGRRSLKPSASEVDKSEESLVPKKGPSSRAQAGQSSRATAALGLGGSKKSSTARAPANPIPVKRGATEDYMSPNLMGRSLAGKRPAAVAKKVRNPEPEDEEEIYEEEVPAHRAEKSKHQDAPRSILDAPHSPLQLSASRRLLELSGGVKVESVNSPKPAFLRRLDSPATHSGALLAKRKDLTKMIRRAVAAVPYLKMASFGKVKDALTEAVLALEASTTRDSPDGISE